MNNDQVNKFVADILAIRSNTFDKSAVPNIKRGLYAVSYTHLTLPTTPYV